MTDQNKELKPGISLCMIVKDEEELLPECLESADPVCDEMVVVDTGSEDRTPEIAENYGARVYHHEWNDSFSEARNQALKYPEHEWILHLDADERLIPEDYSRIREASQRKDVDGFYFYILNELPSGGLGTFYFLRMFRNGQGTHYRGIVHNQVQFQGDRAVRKDIRIRHIGYALDEDTMEEKYQRSVKLLQRQIDERPGDPNPRYFLCAKNISGGRYKKAVENARNALERISPDQSRSQELLYLSTLDHLGLAYQHQEKWEKANRVLNKAMDRDPEFIDALYDLGYNEQQRENFQFALQYYRRYLEVREQWQDRKLPLRISLRSLESPHVVFTNLGVILRKLDRPEEAKKMFKRAISRKPDFAPPYNCLGGILLTEERYSEAYNCLKSGIEKAEPVSPELRMKFGTLCFRGGDVDQALEIFEELAEQNPDEPAVRNNLGLAYLARDQTRKAREAFQKALEIDPEFQDARQNLEAMEEERTSS